MKITIYEGNREAANLTAEQMAAMSPSLFPIADRIPGLEGDAFDLISWYFAWKKEAEPPKPTHLVVEAVDQFRATIPWEQLDQAALLFRQNSEPLNKSSLLRLYVPDGSSPCLNVKNVCKLYFIKDEAT